MISSWIYSIQTLQLSWIHTPKQKKKVCFNRFCIVLCIRRRNWYWEAIIIAANHNDFGVELKCVPAIFRWYEQQMVIDNIATLKIRLLTLSGLYLLCAVKTHTKHSTDYWATGFVWHSCFRPTTHTKKRWRKKKFPFGNKTTLRFWLIVFIVGLHFDERITLNFIIPTFLSHYFCN